MKSDFDFVKTIDFLKALAKPEDKAEAKLFRTQSNPNGGYRVQIGEHLASGSSPKEAAEKLHLHLLNIGYIVSGRSIPPDQRQHDSYKVEVPGATICHLPLEACMDLLMKACGGPLVVRRVDGEYLLKHPAPPDEDTLLEVTDATFADALREMTLLVLDKVRGNDDSQD